MSDFMPVGGAEPEPLLSFQFDTPDLVGKVIDVLAMEAFTARRQP